MDLLHSPKSLDIDYTRETRVVVKHIWISLYNRGVRLPERRLRGLLPLEPR
jgi:hypothetical protein